MTTPRAGFFIGLMKWRNQLLALFCLLVFLAFGVFYFRTWVVQKPFGIILFIGEGLDSNRVATARVYAGGPDTPLTLDALPYTALLKNYSRDSATPDQAAAATALATGVKVNNGTIGVDADGRALENILDLARQSGRMTGIVTNTLLTDATAASFYAHTTAAENREDLARELVEKGEIDVVLGGGSADFLPTGKGGRRTDGEDLLLELRSSGYDVVQNLEELEAVPRWRAVKLFGVFSPAELAFADEDNARADQPRLADMVRRSIELLQFNSGGYLLVVDAGLMRKSAQENKSELTLMETVELDRAISLALEYAGTKSTIFVCGDVSIGGMTRMAQPQEATGLASGPDPERTFDEVAPSSPAAAVHAQPAQNVTNDVVAFGNGLGADALHGTLESTAIFQLIRDNL
ncbi:MAG: alkaline phosphatase [Chthoniobacterales bacterium]|nr:alkaline phosphatase [Chthoniobacterales bacterium]